MGSRILRRVRNAGLGAALLVATAAATAVPVTITFSEPGAPFKQLDGTTFYQALGIAAFQDAFQFTGDARLPDDGAGITNSPGATAAIRFSSAVSAVRFTWAIGEPGTFFQAQAFDGVGLLLDSFFFDGVGAAGSANGVASLAASGVVTLRFSGSGAGTAAIDTLAFDTGSVPEPGILALLGLGLFALALPRRRLA